MIVSIRRLPMPALQERRPYVIVKEPALAALVRLDSSRGLWDARRGLVEGISSAVPFGWRSLRDGLMLRSAVDGYAPEWIAQDAEDGKPYFAFGYGTSSSNPANALSKAQNGSLISEAGDSYFQQASGFTLFSVFRIPTTAQNADAGGTLIGNKLNQTEAYDTGANIRWSGMDVGYASNPGEARLCINGDAKLHDASNAGVGQNDYRDGTWHVGIGTFDYADGGEVQLAGLRIDGNDRGSTDVNSGAVRDLNTTAGWNALRIAATGLPGAAPEAPYVGDLRATGAFVGIADVNQLEDWLLETFLA